MNQSGPHRTARSRPASGAVHVTPAKYAVQSASTELEITRHVADFLDYLHNCHVIALLPTELGTLSARDAAEIRACAGRIKRTWASHQPLTATARFWVEEVSEIFETAVQRLDELSLLEPPARAAGATGARGVSHM